MRRELAELKEDAERGHIYRREDLFSVPLIYYFGLET